MSLMSENTDAKHETAWRLLAEFTLPIDNHTPDRAVAHVAGATARLHLPEARLQQVRRLVVDAISNRVDSQVIAVRLFIALTYEHSPDNSTSQRGWGLFSIQKAAESAGHDDDLSVALEVYFYS